MIGLNKPTRYNGTKDRLIKNIREIVRIKMQMLILIEDKDIVYMSHRIRILTNQYLSFYTVCAFIGQIGCVKERSDRIPGGKNRKFKFSLILENYFFSRIVSEICSFSPRAFSFSFARVPRHTAALPASPVQKWTSRNRKERARPTRPKLKGPFSTSPPNCAELLMQ